MFQRGVYKGRNASMQLNRCTIRLRSFFRLGINDRDTGADFIAADNANFASPRFPPFPPFLGLSSGCFVQHLSSSWPSLLQNPQWTSFLPPDVLDPPFFPAEVLPFPGFVLLSIVCCRNLGLSPGVTAQKAPWTIFTSLCNSRTIYLITSSSFHCQ